MGNLRELYKTRCGELSIKPNSKLVSMLPEDGTLKEFDLADNMIGSKGLLALLPVIEASPELAALGLSGNMIASPAIKDLAGVLGQHPGIVRVDLGDNDIRLAGPDLVDLLKANRRITDINIEGTHLRPLFVNLITMQLKKNSAAGAGAAGAPASPPAVAPQAEETPKEEGEKEEPPAPAAEAPAAEAAPAEEQPQEEEKAAAAAAAEPSAAAPAEEEKKAEAEAEAAEKPKESKPFDDDDGEPGSPFGADSPTDSPRAGFGEFGGFDAENIFCTDHSDPSTAKRESQGAGTTLAVGEPRGATRRATVCAEAYSDKMIDEFAPDKFPKDEETQNFLLQTLESNQLFNHLDDHEVQVVVDAVKETDFAAGDFFYSEGDADMDTAYLIKKGQAALSIGEKATDTVKSGGFVGEVHLLYPQAATETAKAVEDCIAFALNRKTFKFILHQASKKKRAMYEGFLMRVPFLSTLKKDQILQMADALKSSNYDAGETVIKYGEEGNWLHIVVEGTVRVIGRDENDNKIEVCTFTVGDCVGELEFLNQHKTVADVVADGKVRTAKMNRRHFEMCMGPVVEILRKNADKLEVYSYYRETLAKIKQDA